MIIFDRLIIQISDDVIIISWFITQKTPHLTHNKSPLEQKK